MRLIFCLAIFLSSTAALAKTKTGANLASAKVKLQFEADPAWLEREMTRMKLPKGFIKEALATYDEDSFKTVTTLNLLGFLTPPGQHMNHVTPQSVREATKFVQENQEAFTVASQRYQVPPNVISSLLWIETRHGEDMGRFHTTSVFLHLLQVNLKKNQKLLTMAAIEKNEKFQRYTNKEVRKLMKERTLSRKKWAQEQLRALASLRAEKRINIKTLRGSYAGAFGLPQFIPSSFRDFAKALKPKSPPDLTVPDDAIMSVAHYLSKHGWQTDNPEAKVEALMKYNNSRDYADSILEISKRVTGTNPSVEQTMNAQRESADVSSAVSSTAPAGE